VRIKIRIQRQQLETRRYNWKATNDTLIIKRVNVSTCIKQRNPKEMAVEDWWRGGTWNGGWMALNDTNMIQ
jgi:hypothetical protein